MATIDTSRPAGAWPLEPGKSTLLCPRRCGHLRTGAGRVWVNGSRLDTGESLRVWAGERVNLVNPARRDTAFFSWDYCAHQPKISAFAQLLSRVMGSLFTSRQGEPAHVR